MAKTIRSFATTLALVSAILTAASGSAFSQSYYVHSVRNGAYAAQDPVTSDPRNYEFQAHINPFGFDHSGTSGRLGLGANPMSPEGPGNVSN